MARSRKYDDAELDHVRADGVYHVSTFYRLNK